MNKFFKSLVATVILPTLMILTGCNSENGASGSQEPPKQEPPKLERIDIVASPITTRGVSELTIAIGNQQPFEAVGHYSDGSSQAFTDLSELDWHSSEAEVGYFDAPGVFTGVEVGSTTLTATKGDLTSNRVTMNVSAAYITSIQVTPSDISLAKGQTKQLTATAIYSDGTSFNISSSVTWELFDSTYATVTPAGVLTGVEEGSTTLTAMQDDVFSNEVNVNVSAAIIESIDVTPSPINVAKGLTKQLTAMATYSDGSEFDITDTVTWEAADPDTAIVSSSGVLSGVKQGHTTVSATKGDMPSITVDVYVSAEVIEKIDVTPSPINIAKGLTKQLTAMATYSDGNESEITDAVTWKSADPNIAMVSSTGLLSSVGVGSTTLTAIKDNITSDAVEVTVSQAVIESIEVMPSSIDVAKGQTKQLTATAIYSDGTPYDISGLVTWTSFDNSVATVTPAGALTGVEEGHTKLTAKFDDVTSEEVMVMVTVPCNNLAGTCIDTFDTGSGKLFTNSPSVLYLDSIGGGSATSGTFYESGTYGPVGDFYVFTQSDAEKLCTTYIEKRVAGRTNWRLATVGELKEELYYTYRNMFTARGWPIHLYYWSSTPSELVGLISGTIILETPDAKGYASCVSDPEN